MADIILAELNGNAFLVNGEAFLDDLLMNTLSEDVSIEVVPCASQGEVRSLWIEYCGDPGTAAAPWSIHPGILARVLRKSSDQVIHFTPWSAMLDAAALAVIADAAVRAVQAGDLPVVLIAYRNTEDSPMIGDLTLLRVGLITERLVGAGIARERIDHVVRDASALQITGPEPQRIDIAIGPALEA